LSLLRCRDKECRGEEVRRGEEERIGDMERKRE
jgi:hypothetical protein